MEKSLKIIFYSFLGIFCLGVVYLTTVMYLSPRQDADERGFIACTKELVLDLQTCRAGSIGCPFKFLMRDTGCNINVVFTGAAAWIKGNQPTPWANYLFEPKLYNDTAQDNEMPGVAEARKEMSDLAGKSLFIERKQQELEEAKNRQLQINQGVLLYNPENPEEEPLIAAQENIADENIPQGDISAEGNIQIIPSAQDNAEGAVAPVQENIVRKIQKQTEEKLKKGKLKDEK
ncbi:MAG: hypothetical protein IJ738_05935 [Alphaproteobacteria bacterium]|nr:hypothetical protein [Alphaproteobacteria bacterium]